VAKETYELYLRALQRASENIASNAIGCASTAYCIWSVCCFVLFVTQSQSRSHGCEKLWEKMVEIYFCHGSGCGQLQGQAIHDGLDQARTNVDDRMMPVRQCSRNCTMSWHEF